MDVCKQPVTDPSKMSKRGRLSLRRNSDGLMETVERGAGKPEEASRPIALLLQYSTGQTLISIHDVSMAAASSTGPPGDRL